MPGTKSVTVRRAASRRGDSKTRGAARTGRDGAGRTSAARRDERVLPRRTRSSETTLVSGSPRVRPDTSVPLPQPLSSFEL